MRHLVAWLFLSMAAFACAPAAGQENIAPQSGAPAEATFQSPEADVAAPTIDDLRVGFNGRYKVGYWTIAEVTITAGATPFTGQLTLIAPDNDGIPTRVTAAIGEIKLAAGDSTVVPVYFKQGQLGGEITVELHAEDRRLATRTFRAGAAGSLAGVMPSHSRLTLNIGDYGGTTSASGVALTALDNLSTLPDAWYGMEGVDAILLHTSDPRIVAELKRANAQLAALDLWIRMGGKLILCVGRNAAELLAEGGPLADLVPGDFQALVPMRQATVLEAYIETSEPLGLGANLNLEVAQLRDVRGHIESFAGNGPRDLPLVVHSPHGFGEVVLVAFDIDQTPIAEWKARPQLLGRLLSIRYQTGGNAEDEGGSLGAVTTLGFVDLAGQLRGALDQFSGVPLVPFWLVAVLIAAYIACIGPADYYLVRHLLRRAEATWLTFSVTVLAFTAGAAALAYGLKGREPRVNHLDVVDYDLESGFARRTSWTNVFSPEIATYDVALQPRQLPGSTSGGKNRLAAGALLSWFGLTGSGFGGMDAASGAGGGIGVASSNLPLFSATYDYNRTLDELRRVPIAVWSSKSFVGRAWGESTGGIDAQLADDGRLTGTIRNALSVPLTHSVLIYDKWAYVIRDFAPGRELDLALDIDPQTVDTYLRKVTVAGDRKVVAPYDQGGFDVPRIVEIMTAHDLAGGKSYTGLENHYQDFVELSNLVSRGRAVFIGRVAQPATTLVQTDDGSRQIAGDAHTQYWTFHRYVIPVAKK